MKEIKKLRSIWLKKPTKKLEHIHGKGTILLLVTTYTLFAGLAIIAMLKGVYE